MLTTGGNEGNENKKNFDSQKEVHEKHDVEKMELLEILQETLFMTVKIGRDMGTDGVNGER